MKKIQLIEGLRGYLAFWVVFDHLLGACGYSVEKLNGLLKIIRSGWYAVDVFIIISGFVIFYLLDNNEESEKLHFDYTNLIKKESHIRKTNW